MVKDFFNGFKKKDPNQLPMADQDCECHYFRNFLSIVASQAILLFLVVFVIWGSQKLYTMADQAVFEKPYAVTATSESTEQEKGVELINAITNQLKYELDSVFGWSANDIIFNKYVLDNRAYRQFGVYNATKTILDFYSTDIAKLGSSDRENEDLYSSRMNHMALSPSRWGILFIPSAESSYRNGLNLIEKYKNDVLAGNAIYNLRPDDIYNAFELILGDRLLGYAIGSLQSSSVDSFSSVDNNIYEVQGMALVIRDFFEALYILYPEITGKNNAQNYESAMSYLDKICTYNPLVVTNTFNSPELIISYLLFARNRIEDIKESIRI